MAADFAWLNVATSACSATHMTGQTALSEKMTGDRTRTLVRKLRTFHGEADTLNAGRENGRLPLGRCGLTRPDAAQRLA